MRIVLYIIFSLSFLSLVISIARFILYFKNGFAHLHNADILKKDFRESTLASIALSIILILGSLMGLFNINVKDSWDAMLYYSISTGFLSLPFYYIFKVMSKFKLPIDDNSLASLVASIFFPIIFVILLGGLITLGLLITKLSKSSESYKHLSNLSSSIKSFEYRIYEKINENSNPDETYFATDNISGLDKKSDDIEESEFSEAQKVEVLCEDMIINDSIGICFKTIRINPPEKISMIKENFQNISRVSGANFEINNESLGRVKIFAESKEVVEAAVSSIKLFFSEIEVGNIYKGIVRRINKDGLSVECLPGKGGYVCISELSNYRIKSVEDINLNVGDEILVKCIGKDKNGRALLSRRMVLA